MKDRFKTDSHVLFSQTNGQGVTLTQGQRQTSSMLDMSRGSIPLAHLKAEKERFTGGEFYRAIGKRILDITMVLASTPIVLPLIILCALALWIESGLPFYRQSRLGRGGKTFSILKLRTMVRDADTLLAYYLDNDPAMRAEWVETQKLKNDPRITRVGRFLRATSLDELPQLWNVLKGEMSLVGPRPMMPEQLSLYGGASAYFSVRPGLTGTWQVSARNESSFAMRNTMDREYCHSVSFWKDLTLIQRTFGVVIRGTGY